MYQWIGAIWRIKYKNFKIESTLSHICSKLSLFPSHTLFFLISLVVFHISKLLGNNFSRVYKIRILHKERFGLVLHTSPTVFFVIVHRLQEMGKTLEAPDRSIPDE